MIVLSLFRIVIPLLGLFTIHAGQRRGRIVATFAVFGFRSLPSRSVLRFTMTLLSIRQVRQSMGWFYIAFLGLSRTWEQSSLCLNTSISCTACSQSPNINIWSMLVLMCWELREFEYMRPRASPPSLLAWLQVMRWMAEESKSWGKQANRYCVMVHREHC